MPLAKKAPIQTGNVPIDVVEGVSPVTVGPVISTQRLGGTRGTGDRVIPHLSKEEYWDRKEARDIQRDKDMAWSGLAQAALQSPYIGQLNATNTIDGLVDLVAQTVEKLLAKRNAS